MRFVLVVSMLTLLGACGVVAAAAGWLAGVAVLAAAVAGPVTVGVGSLIDWGAGGKAD